MNATKLTDSVLKSAEYKEDDDVRGIVTRHDVGKIRERMEELEGAFREVTRCLAWHVEQGRGVAMDAKAVRDALAVLEAA